MKYVIALALLLCLAGCGGGHTSTTVSASYHMADGTRIDLEKTVDQKTNDSSANPPKLDVREVIIEPKIIGETVQENADGSSVVTPIVGLFLNTGNVNAVGNFLSDVESILPLLKVPMLIGTIILAAGLILWFANPFPLPILRKVGMGASLAGAALVTLSYILATWAWLFNIIGILLLVGLVGWVLWYVFTKKSRALRETVQSLEYVKEQLPEHQKEELFHAPAAPVPLIQTTETRAMVDDIRIKEGFKTETISKVIK